MVDDNSTEMGKDLAALRPELVAEWHPTKNGDLTPKDVTPGSTKRVWWMCSEGHEWVAMVSNRSKGSGCPYCTGKKVLPGFNDLAAFRPELVAEWHPTKNGNLTPKDVTPGSHQKVWWQCSEGHEWEAMVSNRSKGSGCPMCAGQKALPGYNDLATVDPDLAAEWHPTKNGELTPRDVTPGSTKRVWWLGSCGHEWESMVSNRSKGSGCPYCTGKKVLPGFNDLAAFRPELAAEWHPTKNGGLTPKDVTPGSNKKVWWLGPCGHEWESAVSSRSAGSGCPVCSRQKR